MVRRRPSPSFDLFSAYDWFIPGWIDFIALAAMLAVGFGMGVVTTLSMNRAGFAPIYIQLVSYPLLFIPSMLYASSMSRRSQFKKKYAPLDRSTHWTLPVAGVSVVAVLSAAMLCDPLAFVLPPMPESLRQMMEALSGGPLWAGLLCTAVFAPFFEEWLFRGIVLRGLLGKIGPLGAVLVSSLLFGLIHANLWQGIPAFLMALLFGYVYCKTGSLKLTMLMHAVNNAASILLSRLPGASDMSSLRPLFPSAALYAATLVVAALFLVLSLRWFTQVKE